MDPLQRNSYNLAMELWSNLIARTQFVDSILDGTFTTFGEAARGLTSSVQFAPLQAAIIIDIGEKLDENKKKQRGEGKNDDNERNE